MKRPNVLFILSDQHNAKALGCEQHPDVLTPNLDRMAENGVRFRNAITQNPICTPSRVSWLSGQYCHNHGYYGLSGGNPGGLPTVLGHFKKEGYFTGAIGKIHCPEYWVEDDCDLFLESTGCSIGGRPQYNAYLKGKGLLNKEDHGVLQEFGDKGAQSFEGRPSMVDYEDSQEGWVVRKTMAAIEQAKAQDKPFFLHMSLPKPHECYAPAKRFWDMYDQEALTLPPNCFYDMKKAKKAPHLINVSEYFKQGTWTLFEPKTFEAGRLRKLHGYLGNITHVDYAVGEIQDYLDKNNLSEDTIVIYSTDHGDYACEHNIMEKAPGICSDAITRIPMIWQWKGHFEGGKVKEQIVETVDLANTLCALADLPELETCDGENLSELLYGGETPVKTVGVTEFAWSKSIRKGDFRFVYYPQEMFPAQYPDGFGELYDLKADPWEMNNLYFDPAYKNKVEEMREALLNFLIVTTRPATINGIEIQSNDQRKMRYGNDLNADRKINPKRLRSVNNNNYI